MKQVYFSFIALLVGLSACSQRKENPHGLRIVSSLSEYNVSVVSNPELKLVEIKKVIPSIVLDIRYATTDNFMKEVMYKQPRAFARKPVVEQLKKIQASLNKKGFGLKIFDAYRPYAVTLAFYAKASNKKFVADPKKGSKHNRGCAVDLSIISLKTGREIQMPTPYDSFEPAAGATYTNLPREAIKNRDFLIAVMHQHGFKVIPHEWWHFDFIGWEKYPLMDVPFEAL